MKNRLLYLLTGIVIGGGIAILSNTWSIQENTVFEDLPSEFYATLFQNEHVRIIEHKLKPGEMEPMHKHPPVYVYFLEGTGIGIDGNRSNRNLKKGQKLELANFTTHSLENAGEATLHTLIIELNDN